MPQPLEGVRIADFSHVIAGPLATQFLCLLGAEVIKIEPPRGDAMRFYTRDPARRGMAEPFVASNAGKKSVVLDLKTEAGQRAAQDIIASADIMVENFRPGVAARLGLDANSLTLNNPSLIYCAVSGFGQSGPMKDYPAIDQVIQSMSGLMYLSGKQDDDAQRIGFPIVDTYTALLAAFAILAAYTQRQADPARRGQIIDVSMLDASMVLMSSVLAPLMISATAPVRAGNRGFSGQPTADTFKTQDGDITIGAVQDIQVERLFRAMQLEHLLQDDRFSTQSARLQNDEALHAILSAAFATKPAEHWEDLLAKTGVPAGKLRNVAEALDLDQLKGRGLFQPITDPVTGDTIQVPNAGFMFAHDGPGQVGAPPHLGADTETVLKSLKSKAKRA
ncbi:MAG: CaiB/BaiF CoA transferase family protein [Maritimibacter sp.]